MTALAPFESFRNEYADHRAAEGRAHIGADLASLPYLRSGPLARQWTVRAHSYEALLRHVIEPMLAQLDRPLDILDLGAGNGWLSHRLARRGHECIAIDVRDDRVDGLGAATELLSRASFAPLVASFDAVPLPGQVADLAVFNASLHYARDLSEVLGEAIRLVRMGGFIAVVDSPFYDRIEDGEAMVREKRATPGLATFDCIAFLTRDRLEAASPLAWRRHRVRYPLWYELRPLLARLRGARRPSRFDIWTAQVR